MRRRSPWKFSKPKPPHLRRGERSESLASSHLVSQGYSILAVNVRFPVGEIDIIAEEQGVLCFVEVRSTASDAFGGPLATVTFAKQRKILRAAAWYLAGRASPPTGIRFDVIGICFADPLNPRIELIRNAFDASS